MGLLIDERAKFSRDHLIDPATPSSATASKGLLRKRYPPADPCSRGRRSHRNSETAQLCPPSTGRQTPVMNRASSEARNTAALAMSHAVPILPIGTAALRAATISSTEAYWPEICLYMRGVSIRPGMMQLARMPLLAYCMASATVA